MGGNKFSVTGVSPKWVKIRRRKKKKKKKKVGENNGELRFVCHHGWRTQAHLDQHRFNFRAEEELKTWRSEDEVLNIINLKKKNTLSIMK